MIVFLPRDHVSKHSGAVHPDPPPERQSSPGFRQKLTETRAWLATGWFRFRIYPALNRTFDERPSLTMSEFPGPRAQAVLALIKYADLGIDSLEITSLAAHAADLAVDFEKLLRLIRDRSDKDGAAHYMAEMGSIILSGLEQSTEHASTVEPADPANVSARLSLIHKAQSETALELAMESSGTRTWLGLIGPMVKALSSRLGAVPVFLGSLLDEFADDLSE
jgi:hypothetical protein